MNTLDRYLDLKRKAESAQREADKAEGALQQILQQLKSQFGVKTIQDAEKLLEKKLKEKEHIENEANQAMNDFEKKWNGRFD